MGKGKGRVKNFFGEFKKFITRGNVVDLAVGVIIGSAFTAIVTALTTNVFQPIINWILVSIFGKSSLSEVFTFLKKAYDETGALDLANSIYINWGALINAVINFVLVAFILFLIVKAINTLSEANSKMLQGLKSDKNKAIKEMTRKEGITKAEAKAKYEENLRKELEAKEIEENLAKEKAERERIEKETANTRLLEEIRDILKNKG